MGSIRLLVACATFTIVLATLVTGCDEDSGGAGTAATCPGPGFSCACSAASPACPSGETCDLLFGACMPDYSGQDQGADTSADTVTPDSGSEDAPLEDVAHTFDADLVDEPDSGVSTDADAVGSDVVADGLGGSDADVSTTEDVTESPYVPWIAFVSNVDGLPQVQFVRADGTGAADYDSAALMESGPTWHSDGSRLVLSVLESFGDGVKLRVLNFSRGTARDIQTNLGSLANPCWTADGDSIVVEGRLFGETANSLWRVDFPAGGECDVERGCERLTTPPPGGADARPACAQLSDTVYFVRRLSDGGASEAFSVATSGGAVEQHTSSSNLFGGLSLGADETELYYPRLPSGHSDTILMRHTISGGAERAVGDPGDSGPDGFADGEQMALVRATLDTDTELVIVNSSNLSLVERLTLDSVNNSAPAVSPVDSAGIDVANH